MRTLVGITSEQRWPDGAESNETRINDAGEELWTPFSSHQVNDKANFQLYRLAARNVFDRERVSTGPMTQMRG